MSGVLAAGARQGAAYRIDQVPKMVVRELYGVMAAKGVAGGFVITSGRFTDEAVEFARGRRVERVDGAPRLHGWIKSLKTPTTLASQP